jgi:hypothetical protein
MEVARQQGRPSILSILALLFFSLSVLLQVLLVGKNVGVDELAYFVHMTWCFIFCIDHFDQGEIKRWLNLH